MARTTIGSSTRKAKKRSNIKPHRRTQTIKKHDIDYADEFTEQPITESHRFMSSITFDGNTLITKTQKDDEPVIERKYTKEQLAREIPIGKEMVDMYLDGEMPKELQAHHRRQHHYHDDDIMKHRKHDESAIFNNVLISPADLGLLPPPPSSKKEAHGRTKKMRQRRHLRQ
jgi:hypothetical protein